MDLNYIGAAICALQACLIWFIEESPAVTNINTDEEMRSSEQSRSIETLWQKKYAWGLCSGILMMLFQQFCGINAILTNLSDIMDKTGLDINGDYQAGISSCA